MTPLWVEKTSKKTEQRPCRRGADYRKVRGAVKFFDRSKWPVRAGLCGNWSFMSLELRAPGIREARVHGYLVRGRLQRGAGAHVHVVARRRATAFPRPADARRGALAAAPRAAPRDLRLDQ